MAEATYSVERSVTIEAPAQAIYQQLVNFRNWTRWSPWEEIDPQMQRTYSGSETGVGAAYGWSGNRKAGRGRMEIVEVNEPDRVRIDLLFEKPFKSRSDTVFSLVPEGSGQRVTWAMTGPKTFATRVMGLVTSMDKLVGPDFEKGLARLKSLCE